MTGASLAKHYDRLTGAERASMALSAMAREDDRELARLLETCPRIAYRESEQAYTDRLEYSFTAAAAVCMDLLPMLGKVRLLHHLSLAMPTFEPAVREYTVAEPMEDVDPIDTARETDNGPEDDPAMKAELDRIGLIANIQLKSVAQTLTAMAAELTGELATLWEGFGRFCRADVRVEPDVLWRAWRFPYDNLAEMLTAYPDAKADVTEAAALAAMLSEAWAKRMEGR